MTFHGCDIVSLSDPQNLRSFRNPGYARKILSEQEYAALSEDMDTRDLAICWACKESAFKLMMKKGLRHAFSPRLFEVSEVGENCFQVSYYHQKMFVHITRCEDYIFALCTETADQGEIHSNVIRTERPCDAVSIQEQLIAAVSVKTGLPSDHLRIEKEEDLFPVIYSGREKIQVDLSITHDGPLAGFSFIVNNT
jgi:phosphopantetheinyl transferase (holo-ACP synthase)